MAYEFVILPEFTPASPPASAKEVVVEEETEPVAYEFVILPELLPTRPPAYASPPEEETAPVAYELVIVP